MAHELRSERLDGLTLDPRLQMRAGGISEEVAAAYVEVLDDLPPSHVVTDGTTRWLCEGWHRHRAHQIAGVEEMPCLVGRGTFLDALAEAAAANHDHGVPRTTEDKRKAVLTLIEENEAGKHGWSQRQIARMARVSNAFVSLTLSKTAKVETVNVNSSSQTGGNNGKPKPAPTPPVPTTSGESDDEDEKPPPQPLDEADTPLPSQAVAAFDLLPAVRKFCRTLDDAGKELERLGKSEAGVHMHWQSARSQLKSARATVWQGRPAFVCPLCAGNKPDCEVCRGHGFVAAATYHSSKKSEAVREGRQ